MSDGLRAVFDTNVVVSALVFRGRLDWLRLAWVNGAVIPIICRETTAELLRVLTYPKFRLEVTDREALLAEYLPFAKVVPLPDTLPELPIACRDRDDVVFLHLAITATADLLISGDNDLAVLASAYKVASPASLRERLEAKR